MYESVPGTNRPKWDLEEKDAGLSEKFKKSFSEVIDPELGLNIIQLGLIRNVSERDDSILVKMILTTPFCPYGPAMLESTREKAEAVSPKPIVLDLGMEMWDFSMMEEGLGGEWGLYG